MKRLVTFFTYFPIFVFIFFCPRFLEAQCVPPDLLPVEPLCTGAPASCLTGTCFETGSSTTSGGADFCGPGTSLQNPQYFKLIANDTVVTILMTVGCNLGSGLQLAIIDAPEPCTNWTAANVLVCYNGLNGPGEITAKNLTIGNTYYFLIDGFSGAVCEYYFDEVRGVNDFSVPNMNGVISAPSSICSGSSQTFSLNWSDPSVTRFNWYIKEAPSIAKSTIRPPAGTDPSVSFLFPSNLAEGTYNLCVYGFNGCDTTDTEICHQFELTKLATEPMDTIVCRENLPFKFMVDPLPISNNSFNAPGQYNVKFKTAEDCDSIVQLNLQVPFFEYNPDAPENVNLAIIGNDNDLYQFAANDSSYGSGNHEIHLISQQSGCDSLLKLYVLALNPRAGVQQGRIKCDGAQVTVVLSGLIDSISTYNHNITLPPFNSTIDSFNYQWLDADDQILSEGSNAAQYSISGPGIYKLVFSVAKDGNIYSDTFVLNIAETDWPKLPIKVVKQDLITAGGPSKEFIIKPDFIIDEDYSFEWILPNGLSITQSSANFDTVQIAANAKLPAGKYQVCVVINTSCGKDTTCFDVRVYNQKVVASESDDPHTTPFNGAVSTRSSKSSRLTISGTFSPNGDGSNDRIQILSPERDFVIESILVVNLNGQKLHQEAFPDPQDLWNGNRGTQVMPQGIYAVQLIWRDAEGVLKMDAKQVLLLR